MTAPLSDRLQQLEEALAKATPGEWYVARRIHMFSNGTSHPGIGETYMPADAALIVAAVNALPDLIAELRKRDEALARVELVCAHADLAAADQPPLFDGYRFPAQVTVALVRDAAALTAPLAGQHTTDEEGR